MPWVLYPNYYIGSSCCFIAVFVAGIVRDPDSPSSFGAWIHYSAFQHPGVVSFLTLDCFLFFGVAVLTVVQASQVKFFFLNLYFFYRETWLAFTEWFYIVCKTVNIVWSQTGTSTLIRHHELVRNWYCSHLCSPLKSLKPCWICCIVYAIFSLFMIHKCMASDSIH